jgi:pimeloyl-ACP methyl ester carboxylesterase
MHRESSFLSLDSTGFHRVVYSDWGRENGPLVLCVHYLTGNGRYFDALAMDLARQGFRVVAPDMPGRGRSDFLKNPDDYNLRQYVADLVALLAHLGVKEEQSIDWVGASMGGFLGMLMAALPGTPVKRLALIDIGPTLPVSEMQQIAVSAGQARQFSTMAELKSFLQEMRGPSWGPTPDGYWDEFAKHNARALADGTLTLAYDPAIAMPLAKAAGVPVDLWPYWDQIKCPVLLLRGTNSPILPPDVATAMKTRGPGAAGRLEFHEIPGCAHVPSLAMPEQIAIVRDWLMQ